jgi:hypothetical protein
LAVVGALFATAAGATLAATLAGNPGFSRSGLLIAAGLGLVVGFLLLLAGGLVLSKANVSDARRRNTN